MCTEWNGGAHIIESAIPRLEKSSYNLNKRQEECIGKTTLTSGERVDFWPLGLAEVRTRGIADAEKHWVFIWRSSVVTPIVQRTFAKASDKRQTKELSGTLIPISMTQGLSKGFKGSSANLGSRTVTGPGRRDDRSLLSIPSVLLHWGRLVALVITDDDMWSRAIPYQDKLPWAWRHHDLWFGRCGLYHA